MIVRTITVGPIQCNCVILGCEKTRSALVVDPGDEFDRIAQALKDLDLTVKAILHTHAHLDHIGATAPLALATGAPTLLHSHDLPLYQAAAAQAAFLGMDAPLTVPIDRFVQDGESVTWGVWQGEIIHTPGHSPGGVCLRVRENGQTADSIADPGVLLSGDTLFAGSIGRTDLWGGDCDQLLRSIQERLLTLPDETIVIPGHGPRTTIGNERRGNPFLIG
jgi:hydroxyacylglutathione hydrolase